MSQLPAIVLQEQNFIVAQHGLVTIGVVDGLTEPEQMDSLATQLRASAQQNPGGIAYLFIIRDGAQLPPPAVRSRYERTMKEMQGKVRVMAVAIEGAGFGSAAKRSVFTMISGHVIGKIKLKVHPDAPKACAWLAAEGVSCGLALPTAGALASFVASLPATK
jgi:hypothetical protein